MSDSDKEDQQEPKLVVDTDWKEQVAREKEKAAEKGEQQEEAAGQQSDESSDRPPAGPKSPPSESPSEQDLAPPPPASFQVLVSMFFTQAMALLGQMPDPGTGEATVNKPYAKHYIDTLEMLGEKTEGNLSDEESKMLSEALHALRMMYVNVQA